MKPKKNKFEFEENLNSEQTKNPKKIQERRKTTRNRKKAKITKSPEKKNKNNQKN